MSKHTNNHKLHGEVGHFFPPHHEGLQWPRSSKWTRITPTNTSGTLFHVVLRRFWKSWASILSPKNGVQNSILLISSKVLDQMKGEWSHFVSTEPFLLAVFGWFPKSAWSKSWRKELVKLSHWERNLMFCFFLFFKFLIQFLTKMSEYWHNLLLLRRASQEWLVTVIRNVL